MLGQLSVDRLEATSGTTPTTVNTSGPPLTALERTCRPRTSSPGQSRAASDSVNTTTGSDEELLSALKARDLSAWKTLADALPTRFAQALAAAIREAEPKAQRISLPGATIHNQAELEDWLDQARTEIELALSTGPVIL